MKIKKKDFEQLERGIKKALDSLPPDWLETRRAADGYTDKRTRWDVFQFAQQERFLKIGDGLGVPGIPLYGYLDDSHIDAALRLIIGKQSGMTGADHAEAWARENGESVPARDTPEWTALYGRWHKYAWSDFPKTGAKTNGEKTGKS